MHAMRHQITSAINLIVQVQRLMGGKRKVTSISELVGTVCGDNPAVVSLLRRIGRSLDMRWVGGEREFVVALQQ